MRSNYTTSYNAVDDRFEYSGRGIFRCRIKNEIWYIAAFTVAAIIIIRSLVKVWLDAGSKMTANSMNHIFIAFVAFIAIIVFALLYIGAFRTVLSGETYRYIADEKMMWITCPRARVSNKIYYENVRTVEYEDLLLFGKLRGHKVTISCNDGTYLFEYLYPYKMHINNKDYTPFRIIEERSGLLKKPEFSAGKRIDNSFFR